MAVFTMLLSFTACSTPLVRQSSFPRACMVSHASDSASVRYALQVLQNIARQRTETPGALVCPYCRLDKLDERQLFWHMPLHHINDRAPVGRVKCPVCNKRCKEFQVHYHNEHRPAE